MLPQRSGGVEVIVTVHRGPGAEASRRSLSRRLIGPEPVYVGGFLPTQILVGAGVGLSMPAFTAVAVAAIPPGSPPRSVSRPRSAKSAVRSAWPRSSPWWAHLRPVTRSGPYQRGWAFMAATAAVGGLLMLAARRVSAPVTEAPRKVETPAAIIGS